MSMQASSLEQENTRLKQQLAQARRLQRQYDEVVRKLKFAEMKNSAILSGAPDAIISMDYEGRILAFNTAAEKMFGYSKLDAVGKPMEELIIPSHLRKMVRQRLARSVADERRGEGHDAHMETTAMRADGSIISVSFSIAHVTCDGLQLLIGFVKDISERRKMDALLNYTRERLETVQNIARLGSWEMNLLNGGLWWSDEVYHMFSLDPERFNTTYKTFIDIVHPEDRDLVERTYRASVKSQSPYQLVHRLLLPDGSARWVLEHCKTIYADDGTPLRSIGTISDITERKHMEDSLRQRVEEGEMARKAMLYMLEDINESSEVLQKTNEELEHTHVQLHAALEGCINAIGKAVEARDPYTSGHQRRVADLACAIAVELGLDKDQIEGIRMGSLIHDIGKIHLPAEILSKPSRLSEMELMLVNTHSQVGYEILKDIQFPWPVAQIAYQHHERMDGSGYPQGLKGEDICLEARIVAVADVVEAMASHRPYRAGLGIDKALEEIRQHRQTLYAPAVVDACISLFENKAYEMLV